jgi:hypothetical protein
MISTPASQNANPDWPALPIADWQATCTTLHMWTQVVGKVRLALSPLVNHWWQVPLYVTARGLTTSPIPYGTRLFQMDFDFLSHELRIQTTDGGERILPLAPRSVAGFYAETMAALKSLGIEVAIWTTPVEIPNPIPFEKDMEHASYDAEYAQRFWKILVQSHRLMGDFRSRFTGKVSPVHFFWGSFDMAVTRFSGRPAPPHPGAPNVSDSVTREAYSHEVSSCGFWPGGGDVEPFFYAYAYPAPPGFAEYKVQPAEAFFSKDFGEFLLPYEAMRTSPNPDEMLTAFMQTTYEAAAELAQWDRKSCEREL